MILSVFSRISGQNQRRFCPRIFARLDIDRCVARLPKKPPDQYCTYGHNLPAFQYLACGNGTGFYRPDFPRDTPCPDDAGNSRCHLNRSPSCPKCVSIFLWILSTSSIWHKPLATTGWFVTTIARYPDELMARIASTAQGSNSN